MGCCLEIELEDGAVVNVRGNTCPRGKKYAVSELTAPMRTLTSTVKIDGAREKLMPVKTTPIPKENMAKAMELMKDIVLVAPVHTGEVVAHDLTCEGVDLIACKTILQ